ncbi:response regulator transcription factor [bacterium SCSIO 12741]|nr:response regulator transcription factor [bacterium SCSIO 12741]
MIRVALVHEYRLFADALIYYIKSMNQVELVCSGEDAEEALRATDWDQIDVLITGIDIKPKGGKWIVNQVKARNPRIKTIAFSMYDRTKTERMFPNLEVFDAFMEMKMSMDEFEQTLKNVVGKLQPQFFSLPQYDSVAEEAKTAVEDFNLTEHQLRVFELIADNKENHQIAEELGVSYNTIKTHVRRLYTRLGVNNRGAVMKLAFELGVKKS